MRAILVSISAIEFSKDIFEGGGFSGVGEVKVDGEQVAQFPLDDTSMI